MGAFKSKEKASIKDRKEEKEKTEEDSSAAVTLKGIKHLEDHPEYVKNGDVSNILNSTDCSSFPVIVIPVVYLKVHLLHVNK